MDNQNIQAALAEVQKISQQFGNDSWQAKKASQMMSDAKGKYFARLSALSEQEKEKESKAFVECKTVDEYDYWMMRVRAWYHNARLKALEEYLIEAGAKVPSKLGESLEIPSKRLKNAANVGRICKKSYWRAA